MKSTKRPFKSSLATDVRIGNLLYYKIQDDQDKRKEWLEVDKIDAIDMQQIMRGDHLHFPIPLAYSLKVSEPLIPPTSLATPDFWLNELGWKMEMEKEKGGKPTPKQHFGHPFWEYDTESCKYLCRVINGKATFGMSYHDTPTSKYMFSWSVQYVHELQNLMRFVTGKELQHRKVREINKSLYKNK